MANYKAPVNPFPIGNQFYKSASLGRQRKFNTPVELWEAACGYFEWCCNNPIIVKEIHGEPPQIIEVEKMRGMSVQGLGNYIGVCNLRYYQKLAAFSPIVMQIYATIQAHNLEGALAVLINPRIVWRVLGTMERKITYLNENEQLKGKVLIISAF